MPAMEVMSTAEIVGDVVQIILSDTAGLGPIGIVTQSPFLKVVGLDELGLWVEHPQYVVVKTNDEHGRPLPENQQVRTQLEANFLLRWDKIITVVHFPNREGFDFPNPMDDKPIGFVTPKDD